ncbi:DarT ssDNA thymidine ADP-ribosyltransferase family protein [Levilactobacillus angrenensis]|uniref:DarT ssDNA thymidine ADP-ribosyltransferase family protein n=1 Tax=Levilactobacillus angrenensis TaxID=2486020 RepID=A0ABW1U9Z4_9LACO|nr:DarT ssDNA thymidine ADP-ribosyltransferase family protein [Levilactobacillus angrenensis]
MDFQAVINDILNKRIPTDLDDLKLKMWPRFAYHFTDILNAVNILKEEHIYSRNYAIQNGLMRNDNASNQVISQTSSDVGNYVRLYFRPKTPTQFYNEGFQVKSSRKSYMLTALFQYFLCLNYPSY